MDIKEMINELQKRIVERKWMPYAILMNAENFRILNSQPQKESGMINFPNWKAYSGIPVVINEDYPLKAVTEEEYYSIYKASK